ncbi:MAG: sel1 repeat family protein [Rhodanobacteraceae bacterium]|nr:sel1 repeat family protein [Rhodanobacteraceae bacterium]
MSKYPTLRLAMAIVLAVLPGAAALAISSAPAPIGSNLLAPLVEPPLAGPKELDLSRLPPELGSLRLDGLLSRIDDAMQRCGELAPLARAAAQDEPQRPGPLLLVGLCARASGDDVGAAEAFSRMRERVEASLAPPGVWEGDAYYYGVGTLDVAAVAMALDPAGESTVIATALEVSGGGYRVHEVFWLRQADGRIRRVRVDVTPSAERVMRYVASTIDDVQTRDVYAALPGAMSVNVRAGQLAAQAQALAGRARIALRTGLFGGEEQARKDLERAVAQDDAFARYAYAEWLLTAGNGDSARALALLRGAAQQQLPEAQVLLALWCEVRKGCARAEAAAARAAAVRAYGEAEVFLLRYEMARRFALGDGQRDLRRALDKGSVRAIAVRIHQLAESVRSDKRAAREHAALVAHGADIGLAYALVVRGLTTYGLATTRETRAAARVTLQRAAQLGSGIAATQLGASFLGGEDDDPQRALEWHHLAAERGEALGQYNYATVLLNGIGVAVDETAARQWFMRSAMQGQVRSLRALGDLYATGRGVAADAARAVRYYAAAARGGDRRSQYLYGLALYLGDGVAEDRAAALSWYERAAAQGSAEATLALARADFAGSNPKAGIERLAACAETGAAACRRGLAGALMVAPEPLQDIPRALALLEHAAAAGDARALMELHEIYQEGRWVAADHGRASGYLQRCDGLLGEGAGDCLALLGAAYRFGWSVEVNREHAAALLQRGRDLGSSDAICALGDMAHEDGNQQETKRLFAESAAAGNALCMRKYAGLLLETGDATQAAAALDWLKKADAAGDLHACADIAVVLLQQDSPLHDESAGMAYAEQCVSDGAYPCIAAAGRLLLRRANPDDHARALNWLESAAKQGDKATARVLGIAAYYGYGRTRDTTVARRWLTQADTPALEGVLLARLDLAAGDTALAKERLIRAMRGGNAYAQLLLLDLCQLPGMDCGSDAPTAAAWLANLERRGEYRSGEILNEVAWALATDPLATAAQAQRLVALIPQARYGLRDELADRDTWAALLARAGRSDEACVLQRRIVADAQRANTAAVDLHQFEQHRDAFCRGATWDAHD